MMYYTTTRLYVPSNSLHKDVNEALELYNKRVWGLKMLPVIKSSITNVITQLNAENKRCKPMDASWKQNTGSAGEKSASWYLFLNAVNEYSAAVTIELVKDESDL